MQFPAQQPGSGPYYNSYDQYSRDQQNQYAALQYWSYGQPSWYNQNAYAPPPPPTHTSTTAPPPPPSTAPPTDPVCTVPLPPDIPTTVESTSDVHTATDAISDNDSECESDSEGCDDMSAIHMYLSNREYKENTSKSVKKAIRRRAKQFVVVKDVLFYQQVSKVSGSTRRQVITSKTQRSRIIQQCHAMNGVDGHFGEKTTLSAVQARFYWKGIVQDVNSYVKVCDPCQRENPQLHKVPATLHPIPVTAAFWHQVGVDLVGPLQETKDGNKYMLTCCCYFTKWTEAIPIKDKTAQTVALELFKLQCQKGSAAIFIHDQGTEFVNQVNDTLCSLMGISKGISTAYHPMTNGLDERWNQTLQTALRKVIDPDTQDDWDDHLEPIMSAYRATRHESTGMSPYFLVHHQEPRLPVDVEHRSDSNELQEGTLPVFHDADVFTRYATAMKEVKAKIKAAVPKNIARAQARQKKNFDKRHLVPSYAVGTVVLLKNMKRNGRMGGKMESHYSGPYEIVEELGHGVYRLKNLKTQKVMAKTCNSMRFKVYHSDTGTSNSTSPGDSDTERTSTEHITSNNTPPDSISDDPTSPPTKKRRIDIDINNSSSSSSSSTPIADDWLPTLHLNQGDKDLLQNGQELNDKFMDAASLLLLNQFPNINGLQSTLIIDNVNLCNKVSTTVDSIQFIHQHVRQHWIAAAMTENELYIYDSLLPATRNKMDSDTRQVIQNVFDAEVREYITTDVTQQKGSVDCGLFAVAYLTALCHGLKPEEYRFQQPQMRRHFMECLESGQLTPFPSTKKRQRKPLVRLTM